MKLHLSKTLLTAVLSVLICPFVYADDIDVGQGNGSYKVESDMEVNTGDRVGTFDGDGKLITSFNNRPTNNLVLKKGIGYKNLTINGSGQVAVGGQNDSDYMGLKAKNVTVNGDGSVTNLIATKTFIEKLEIQKGSVELHGGWTSGNSYLGAHNILVITEASKMAQITSELVLYAGSKLTMGTTGATLSDSHFMNGFGLDGVAGKSATITQYGGTMTVYGYSIARQGLQINQSGDGSSMTFRDKLYISGNGTNKITQNDKASLVIGNLASDSTKNKIDITQNGSGSIEIQETTSGSYTITQNGTGDIILGKNNGALITINQTSGSSSSVDLQEGSSYSTTSLVLDTTGGKDAALSVDGALTINSGATLKFTMGESNSAAIKLGEKGNLDISDARIDLMFGDALLQEMENAATLEGVKYTIDLISGLSSTDTAEIQTLLDNGSLTLSLPDYSTVALLAVAEDVAEPTNTLNITALGLEIAGSALQASVLVQNTATVPEPATTTLSLLALTALAARRRRK